MPSPASPCLSRRHDVCVAGHRWLARTGDVGDTALLAVNRWFNTARRLLGFPYWSLSAYVKGKVKRAVEYVGDFENAVLTRPSGGACRA